MVGARDGDLYSNYFEVISNIPNGQETPYWDEFVKPITTRTLKSKL
jgi:hypothetical protein